MLRHPSPCNLYFRSIRGCHRQNCNYRHLPIQENNTVLIARDDNQKSDELHAMIAAQQIQMSELHERLAAQEIQTKELLVNMNKLGCKQGNNEASFKRLLETQNIKLSGEIGCLDAQVQRNKETKLKPPELSNLISELTDLKTNIETKMQKMVDEKLKEQNNLHRSDLTEMDAKLDAQVTELKAIDEKVIEEKLKTKDNTEILDRFDNWIAWYNDKLVDTIDGRLNRYIELGTLVDQKVIDRKLAEYTNKHRCKSELNNVDEFKTTIKTIDVKLEEHKNLVRSELDRVDEKQKRYREEWRSEWMPLIEEKENDWQMGYTDYLRKALRDFAGNSFLHPHTCESLAKILDRLYTNLLMSYMDPFKE